MTAQPPTATGRRRSERKVAVALAAAIALGIAATGCGGRASPFDRPPASFDPNSPTLVAEDIAFATEELEVPANRPFTLVFENRDSASHNVAIQSSIEVFGEGRLEVFFDSTPFGGPGTRWYPVPALAPGEYRFVCALHSNMFGTLVAK